MKNKVGLISMGVCGLTAAVLIIGLIARLSASLIRISGVVMLASLVFTVYRLTKDYYVKQRKQ